MLATSPSDFHKSYDNNHFCHNISLAACSTGFNSCIHPLSHYIHITDDYLLIISLCYYFVKTPIVSPPLPVLTPKWSSKRAAGVVQWVNHRTFPLETGAGVLFVTKSQKWFVFNLCNVSIKFTGVDDVTYITYSTVC